MDTGLRPHRPCFELRGGAIAQGRMTTGSIVEHFDPFKIILSSLFSSEVAPMRHELRFQRMKEPFDHGIVPAVPTPTHARRQAVTGQQMGLSPPRIPMNRGDRSTSAANVASVTVIGLLETGKGVWHCPHIASRPSVILSRRTRLIVPQVRQRINGISDITCPGDPETPTRSRPESQTRYRGNDPWYFVLKDLRPFRMDCQTLGWIISHANASEE